MRAYGHLLGLAVCGYEEYMGISGGKHTHIINTNTASLQCIVIIIKMISEQLANATEQFESKAKKVNVHKFSRNMCSNLWLSGARFGRLCSPQLFQNNQPSTI